MAGHRPVCRHMCITGFSLLCVSNDNLHAREAQTKLASDCGNR